MNLSFRQVLLWALAGVFCQVASAQSTTLATSEVDYSSPLDKANLGQKTAVWGDWCAAADGAGRVQLFQRSASAWTLRQTLLGVPGQGFGSALALGAGVLVVGAPGSPASPAPRGAAYVFRLSSTGEWSADQILQPSPGSSPMDYGRALGLAGSRLVVGAPGQEVPGAPGAGVLYVYEALGGPFALQTTLQASDGQAGDALGWALYLSGDFLVAGAPWADPVATNAGAVYLWRRSASGWMEEAKLLPNDPLAAAAFGYSVATDGQVVVVGAPGARSSNQPAGKAYAYAGGPNAWSQVNQLFPVQARPFDRFGVAVAIDEGILAVGSMGDDHAGGVGAGSVTLFTENSGFWVLDQLLAPESLGSGSFLGSSLDLRAGTLAVGAPGYGGGAGLLSMYRVRMRVGTSLCSPAQPHSGGTPARLFAYGSEQLAENDLRLVATQLPAATFAVFLVSDTSTLIPGFQRGQGTLCLAAPFGRFDQRGIVVDGTGRLEGALQWSALPAFGGAVVGQTYHFQAWFRDRNPQVTTNFSDAVSLTVQ